MTTTATPAAESGLPTIPQLYESWLRAFWLVEHETGDLRDDSPIWLAYREIEEALLAAPVVTLRDLAIKIVVNEDAGGGTASGGLAGRALVAEARRLVEEAAA